jgi:arylsulfatase A-like enzyme
MFRWTHGFQLAPEVLDVPLIIGGRARRTSQVKHYTEVTRSIDVVPTLLGMAGAEPRRDFAFDGVDLSEAVLDGQQQPQLVALSHGSIVHPRVAERSSSWTLFHRYYSDTSPENVWVRVRQRDLVVKLMRDESLDWVVRAFDLSKDPSETSDIFSSADEEHTHLRSQALAYKQEIIRAYLTRREANQRRNRDPEADLERLRALGYIK